jgi:hypothetical protein
MIPNVLLRLLNFLETFQRLMALSNVVGSQSTEGQLVLAKQILLHKRTEILFFFYLFLVAALLMYQ